MAHPRATVIPLKAVGHASEDVDVTMTHAKTGEPVGGPGLEMGGYVKLGTATLIEILVTDVNGKGFGTGRITPSAGTFIESSGHGVTLPLKVRATNKNGTYDVYWWVQK